MAAASRHERDVDSCAAQPLVQAHRSFWSTPFFVSFFCLAGVHALGVTGDAEEAQRGRRGVNLWDIMCEESVRKVSPYSPANI